MHYVLFFVLFIKNNVIFKIKLNSTTVNNKLTFLAKQPSWSLHNYELPFIVKKTSNANTLQKYLIPDKYNLNVDRLSTHFKYILFLKKKNIILYSTNTKKIKIKFFKYKYTNTLKRKYRLSRHNFFSSKFNTIKAYSWLTAYTKNWFHKYIKKKKSLKKKNSFKKSYTSFVKIISKKRYNKLSYFYSKFFRFIFKSKFKKNTKRYLYNLYIDQFLKINKIGLYCWFSTGRYKTVIQSSRTYDRFKRLKKKYNLNWFFLLKHKPKLTITKNKVTIKYQYLSRYYRARISRTLILKYKHKARRPYTVNLKTNNLIINIKDCEFYKNKQLNKNTLKISLIKIINQTLLKKYLKKHKVWKKKIKYKTKPHKCLSIISRVIKIITLYYGYYYTNEVYWNGKKYLKYTKNYKLNRFLNSKYATQQLKRPNVIKANIFTYYFNITSYKLFFNLIILFPFLLINYMSKNLTINKLLFNNTKFKLINPHDMGDDRIIYFSSMYVEIGSFLECFTGKNVNLLIYKNSFTDITNLFKLILNIWVFRIKHFYRTFKNKFDLSLVMKLLYLSIKNKDIHLLIKIIRLVTPRVEFKKQRKFFKFIIFMFRTYFSLLYPLYNIQGYQFEFRGKISVDGNARTRKMYAKILRPSPSNYTYSTRYVYKTINTYTGVMGVKIWIYYSHT